MTKSVAKTEKEIKIPYPQYFDVLDDREKKFVLGKLQGMSNVDAALYAGYAQSTALIKSHLFMRRENVKLALGTTLAQLGLDFKKILQPVLDGLEATKTTYIGRGDKMKEITKPDLNIRLKATTVALKLLELENNQSADSEIFDDDEIKEAVAKQEPKAAPKPPGPSEEELRRRALVKRLDKLDDVQLIDAVFENTAENSTTGAESIQHTKADKKPKVS